LFAVFSSIGEAQRSHIQNHEREATESPYGSRRILVEEKSPRVARDIEAIPDS